MSEEAARAGAEQAFLRILRRRHPEFTFTARPQLELATTREVADRRNGSAEVVGEGDVA
jgi:hypothetical protein